jgi:hypothetical protein
LFLISYNNNEYIYLIFVCFVVTDISSLFFTYLKNSASNRNYKATHPRKATGNGKMSRKMKNKLKDAEWNSENLDDEAQALGGESQDGTNASNDDPLSLHDNGRGVYNLTQVSFYVVFCQYFN